MDELIRSIEEQQKPLRDTFDHITRVERVDAETIQVEGVKDSLIRTERLTKSDPHYSFSDANFDTYERSLRERMTQEALPLVDTTQRRLTCLLCGKSDTALTDNPDAHELGVLRYLQHHATVDHIDTMLRDVIDAGGGDGKPISVFAVRHDLPGGVEWDLPEPDGRRWLRSEPR